MSKRLRSLSSGSSTPLLAILVAAAASVVACAKEEPKKAAGWTCTTGDVPMGEVVRCTQQAATADGPSGGTTDGTSAGTTDGTTDGTSDGTTGGAGGSEGGGTSDGSTSYDCPAGSDNPDCPPSDTGTGGSGGTSDGPSTSSGSGTSDGTTNGSGDGTGGSGGTSDGSGSSDSATNGNGNGNGGSGGNGNSNGNGNGSSDSATNGNGNGNGNGGSGGNGNGGSGGTSDGTGSSDGTTNGPPGPDECGFTPDLPYCGGGNGNGSGSGTSDGSATGGDGTGNGSGTGESSGANGGGKGKGGHSWHCTKDKHGNKTCESTPDCAKGTKPSACGACVPEGESSDCVPPAQGGCWVTGGGFIVEPSVVPGAPADGHDNFGGNAKPMKDGRIQGHWNHVDHGTGNHAKGRPEYIVCRHVDEPGPGQPGGKKGLTANQVYFGGPAEWRESATGAWAEGYWFDVVAKDHGEPGSVPHAKNGFMVDTYHFTIRKMDDPANKVSGAVVYEVKGGLVGGNVQLHPPNNGHPSTPMSLPSWVSYEP